MQSFLFKNYTFSLKDLGNFLIQILDFAFKKAVGLVHSAGVESALTHGMEQEPPRQFGTFCQNWFDLWLNLQLVCTAGPCWVANIICTYDSLHSLHLCFPPRNKMPKHVETHINISSTSHLPAFFGFVDFSASFSMQLPKVLLVVTKISTQRDGFESAQARDEHRGTKICWS